MSARARRVDEKFSEYRASLKDEASALKNRLRGTWCWKTFFPVTSMENLPTGAQVFERVDGKYNTSKTFNPQEKQHFVKFPPYVNPKREAKRATRRLEELETGRAQAVDIDGERA